MNENFMYADLSIMVEFPKCAVICRSIEELNDFFLNAQQQLSEYLYWNYNDIKGVWSYYKEKTGFTLYGYVPDELEQMSYCSDDWFVGEGYEIIEFSTLCNVADIEESDQSVDFLFGGAV